MSRISLPRLDHVESAEAHDEAMDRLVAAFTASRTQLSGDGETAIDSD